jgi:rhombotail lipoprotein
MRVLVAILLGCLLTGCTGSHGFNRDAMHTALQHEPGRLSEPEAGAGKPVRPVPFKLALFFVDKDFPSNGLITKADWVTADKETVMTALAPLKTERIVSDIFLLEDSTIKGYDENKTKRAGRRYGADIVLIVDGVAAVDRFNNASAWLYATLVGAYLAKGTESDALFIVDGVILDVHGERRYAEQRVEGQSRQIGPAMSVDDKDVLAQAKQAALVEFGQRMADHLRQLR